MITVKRRISGKSGLLFAFSLFSETCTLHRYRNEVIKLVHWKSCRSALRGQLLKIYLKNNFFFYYRVYTKIDPAGKFEIRNVQIYLYTVTQITTYTVEHFHFVKLMITVQHTNSSSFQVLHFFLEVSDNHLKQQGSAVASRSF